MKKHFYLLVIPCALYAQTTINGGRIFMGRMDASGATSTLPYRTGTGSPAGRDTCNKAGEAYFQTDAAVGQNLWVCTGAGTPGTWSQMTAGSSGVKVNLDGSQQGTYGTWNLVTPTGLSWGLSQNGSTLNVAPSLDTSYLLTQTTAQNGSPFLCVASSGGGGAAYNCNLTPARASYANGMVVEFRPDVNCSGGLTTLNVNALSPKKVFKIDGATNLAANDCRAGSHYWLLYNTALDGGNGAFEFTSLLANYVLSDSASNGMVSRTSYGTTVSRIITAGNGIVVSNGDGVSANPTISLDTTGASVAGHFYGYNPGAGTFQLFNFGAGFMTVGNTVQMDTAVLPAKTANNSYVAGAKQSFTANATTAGLNVSVATLPSAPVAGDIAVDGTGNLNWYDGTAWRLGTIADAVLTAGAPLIGNGTNHLTTGSVTGTGSFVLSTAPTIANPTITSFINSNHDHSNAANGGALSVSAFNGGVNASSSTFLRGDGTWAAAAGGTSPNQNIRRITFTFDGGGIPLSGTIVRCNNVAFSGTIQQFTAVGDVSGSATVKVLSVAFGSYTGPGSAADISNGGESITSAISKQDSTLTSWTTSLSANSEVCFQISNESNFTWLAGELKVAAN